MKILYLLNVFPKLSETFILNEITGLIDLGHDIKIIALHNLKEEKVHDKVKEYNLINKTKYLEFYSDWEEKTNKYSKLKVFELGSWALFNSSRLSKEERFKLLDLLYESEPNNEVAFRKFLDCLDIIKIIKEKKIKHIHCHFADENVAIAYIINKVIGIPYTFTTHAYDIFISPDKDIKKWADNAKKVITISEYNKKYMYEKLRIPLEKIEIVTYSKYLNKLKPIKEYRNDPFRLISISRLIEKKGYPYLIKACKILKDKGISFSCDIQGEGKQKEELKELIKKNNLENDIKLGGVFTHEEVLEFMETGSVFVLPCIQAKNGDMDGIPNVLMESMAKEIPTISTKLVGIPELIENNVNGILVPQKNPETLAEAIIKIKNDNEFADRIRKKGRERVMEKFNVEKNVRKLLEVFSN